MMTSCHVGCFNVVISTGILRNRLPRNAQSPVCPAQDRYGISVLASKRCAARINRDRQSAAARPDAAQLALAFHVESEIFLNAFCCPGVAASVEALRLTPIPKMSSTKRPMRL
jgi:hypothetical protein